MVQQRDKQKGGKVVEWEKRGNGFIRTYHVETPLDSDKDHDVTEKYNSVFFHMPAETKKPVIQRSASREMTNHK